MENVQIVRSAKRRSIGIQVMPDLSVRVSAPPFIPRFMINAFLKEKEAWIKEAQGKLRIRAAGRSEKEFFYLGKKYPLELRKNKKNIIELEDKFYLASSNIKYAKTYLESWYKQQARKIILQRVHHYAAISGLTYKSIALSGATTRWGSCSSDKSLHFNWKLIMAPLEVVDYVIAHELAHLTEMNHSRDFWETVRKMFPIYRQYRTWLKRYGHTLTV